MFRLFRRFASSKAPEGPRERALASLARADFAQAEAGLDTLLAGEADRAERCFLLNKRGVARIGRGALEPARDDFEAALALDARYAPALANLGNMALDAGDLEAAIARYRAAIAADDENATAHMNLGIAYKRAGRFAEGVRELRRAQALEGRRLRPPMR